MRTLGGGRAKKAAFPQVDDMLIGGQQDLKNGREPGLGHEVEQQPFGRGFGGLQSSEDCLRYCLLSTQRCESGEAGIFSG